VATLKEKLASSLEKLHELQSGGRRVFRSKEFQCTDRERLLRQGFVREVIKGWVISTNQVRHRATQRDNSLRSGSLCTRYCDFRFGKSWRPSPEQSLLLQAEDTVIPAQVMICSPQGHRQHSSLRFFGTFLYDLKSKMPKRRISRSCGVRASK
jgi:hypothetical protein